MMKKITSVAANAKPRQIRMMAIVGLAMFVFSLLYLFVILPAFLRYSVKKQVALKKGWPMREIWSKLPFITEMHVYLFNLTNHMEVGDGAKPIVQEIGPFVYDVHQEKVDQIDNDEEDTVSYIPKNLYYYNKIKSNGLSDELEVYFPHMLHFTVSNGPVKVNSFLIHWTTKGVDSVMKDPESSFYRMKVRNALFDGAPIPCAGVDDYFGRTICNELRKTYYDYTLRRVNDTFLASAYSWLNGTYDKDKRVRIKRGVKKLDELGKVVGINDKDNIDTWNDEKCDSFLGTDGTIFPPFIDPDGKDDMTIVLALACRKFLLTFESKVKYAGLNLLRYTIDLGTDGDHVDEEKCYCSTPDTCLRKGMFELVRCINVPIVVSNPHFYKADPYYLTRVDTLRPDKEKHMLYIDFDALSGTPVRAHIRLQFNIELIAIENFRLARNYTYSVLPILWHDEVMILPQSFISDLKMGHRMAFIAKMFGYTLMSVGLVLMSIAAYITYKTHSPVRRINSNPATMSKKEVLERSIEERNAKIQEGLRAAPVPQNFN